MHGDEIRLAGGDDLLRLGDVLDGAHGIHDQVRVGLLDVRRKMDVIHLIQSVGLIHILHVLRLAPDVVDAAGDMEDIHLVLDIGDEFQRLVEMGALGGMEFLGGDAVLDHEVFPDSGADRVQHLHGEAGAVFRAPAVLVRAPVEKGAGKLGKKIAVGPVKHQHFHAGLLAEFRGKGKFLHRLPDLFFAHLNGGDGVAPQLRGALALRDGDKAGGAVSGASAHPLGDVVLAAVAELQIRMGAVAFAHLAELRQLVHAGGIGELELPVLVAALRDVDGAVSNGDDGDAALCEHAEAADESVRDKAALIPGSQRSRGSQFDPILEGDAPDGDGGEYMGIFR